MTDLKNYMQDGANHQARAVLAFIQGYEIHESWNDELRKFDANPKVSRWENCREQGYVISLRAKDHSRQLNIAFFEHRNTDGICAVKWEQVSDNSITIETAKFGDAYKDKWDVSHSVGFGEIGKMALWIKDQLTIFWNESSLRRNGQW